MPINAEKLKLFVIPWENAPGDALGAAEVVILAASEAEALDKIHAYIARREPITTKPLINGRWMTLHTPMQLTWEKMRVQDGDVYENQGSNY